MTDKAMAPQGLRTMKFPDLGGPLIWVGAVSFEDRCAASVERMPDDAHLLAGYVIDYGTVVRPLRRSEDRRRRNRQRVLTGLHRRGAECRRRLLVPYRMSAIRGVLDEAIAECVRTGARMVLDVSCWTKIHSVGFAEWLLEDGERARLTDIVSTVPLQYGWQESQALVRGDYRDVVFAPVGDIVRGPLSADWRSTVDVIALLGHEGVRLRLALSTLELARGLAVVSGRAAGSDVGTMATLENGEFLDDVAVGRLGSWQVLDCSPPELGQLWQTVQRFADSGRSDRLVIIPLGPKPVVLQAALAALTSSKGSGLWVNYPVPQGYSLDYSVGAGSTSLFCVELKEVS